MNKRSGMEMKEHRKTVLEELISDLKQQRDQIRVRLHLGGLELKEEWVRLGDRLDQLNHRFDPLKNAVGETADDVWESLGLMASELKDGFNRIRKAL